MRRARGHNYVRVHQGHACSACSCGMRVGHLRAPRDCKVTSVLRECAATYNRVHLGTGCTTHPCDACVKHLHVCARRCNRLESVSTVTLQRPILRSTFICYVRRGYSYMLCTCAQTRLCPFVTVCHLALRNVTLWLRPLSKL